MPTTHIRFAKLIATPHETSWSQAYNAGGLFLVFSLAKEQAKAETTLNAIGKEVINNIEAEFFTLEDKNLQSIASALTTAIADITKDVTLNMSLAYSKDDILYIYLYGSGDILMKRDDRTAVLLSQSNNTGVLKQASGRLQDGDTLLLATKAFTKHFSEDHIDKALSHTDPEKAVAGLIPLLETTENGEIASLFLSYRSPQGDEEEQAAIAAEQAPTLPESTTQETDPLAQPEQTPDNTDRRETEEQTRLEPYEQLVSVDENSPRREPILKKLFKKPTIRIPVKKLFLILLALILVIVIGVSALLAIHKNSQKKQSALFQSVYAPSEKLYEEGVGLENLNKTLANNDFTKAKDQLTAAQDKFAAGSPERQQVDDLLKKIQDKLGGTSSGAHEIQAKEVTSGSDLLTVAKSHSDALGIAEDSSNIYILTSKAVTKTGTDGSGGKDIITNDSDWTNAVGLAAYQGNLYVLDQKQGILKYVAGSDGYGKSSYFPASGKPDLGNATDLAIDGSVWILRADGQIQKFTRGQADSFQASGVPTLSHPTRIVTSIDMQNLYVLDTGNNAIVKIDKNGTFQQTYNASVLGSTSRMAIDEKNSTAYVLSGGKIYSLSLQ